MKQHDDFLVEIHTEELPPKSLLTLSEAFTQEMKERLEKAHLAFKEIETFATPRRLAVLVRSLAKQQPDQTVERRGPALSAAYDVNGKATAACEGFARSCRVTTNELKTIKNDQGTWVAYTQTIPGKNIETLLPGIVEQSLLALPIPKRMRWGSENIQFVRPVHSIVMLYGKDVIEGTVLGLSAGRETVGHRFHAGKKIKIPSAALYEDTLENKGKVIARFSKRREKIIREIKEKSPGIAEISEDLLDEVTGLVEWPVVLCGTFEPDFLAIPHEVLISSMQDHQRYFPVRSLDHQQLMPHFILISNIESRDPKRVIHGNERVLRARLSDAAFFYNVDKQQRLEERLPVLKNIIYQDKLGTLYDKAERLSKIMAHLSNSKYAARAGLLSKADLTSNMVQEFPELQGTMGGDYAEHDGEVEEIAIAIKEHYLPKFGGDELPEHPLGQALALADRLDSLYGAFAINQIPTGDKDPFGLRRAALGVIRILIEKQIDLDLKTILESVAANYQVPLENKNAIPQLLNFIQERLRAWYAELGISADVFASVAALKITNILDFHKRIQAVRAFKQLREAETLSIANKRVSNILSKYQEKIALAEINDDFFEMDSEKILAQQLIVNKEKVAALYQSGDYEQVLFQLASLRDPIDIFFDQVMVMTEDKERRENRILLLQELRALFTKVADIALLQ